MGDNSMRRSGEMLPARPQGNITTTTTILRTRPSNGRCYSPVFVLLLAAVLTTLPSSTAFVSHHHPTALYRPTRQTRQSPQFIPLLPKTTLAPTVVKSHQNYRYPHSSCLAMTTGTNRSSGESSLVTPPTTTTTTNNNHLHHPYSYKRAVMRTAAWVSAAVVFGGAIWTLVSPELGEEFFAGYLVEQSLSVDNLFVFLLLFEYFQVPLAYQDRVLNWGIYGAIVMRGIMISLGVTALENFHQILLVFAGILVYSSAKFFLDDHNDENEEEDPSENSVVQFSKALLPSVDYFENDRFFTVVDGIRRATPLFICMVAVEISDVVFAVDSIPAVFGVTEEPLIVFSSNMFAIMGLRSLYTILSQAATDLKYLEPAVALVLGFIGSKMIAEYAGYGIPTAIALSVVATLLGSGIVLSLWERARESAELESNE